MEAECSKMSTRNSTRSKKRKYEEITELVRSDQDPEPAEWKPTRKRGKSGKLAGLVDLPIDILLETFGHLRPLDLLRLARMTKEFRRLLMHKSSVSVWRRVLDNVPGLPPCPPGMDEPQWVNLAFDPHCHFCLTTGVRIIDWRLRTRICAKCAKDQIVETYIPNNLPPPTGESTFRYETLISSRIGKRLSRGYFISDYKKVKKDYEALMTAEARDEYVRERREIMAEIEKHSTQCEVWAQNQTDDRSMELSSLRIERRVAIIKKLESLGWGRDIASIRYPDALEAHELVKRPQRLTERVWINIKGPIIQFMEEMRTKRLAREHTQLVLQRKPIAAKVLQIYKNSRLPITEVMPEVMDFCLFPPIKAVLEQPADVTVDVSSFPDEVMKLVPDLIEDWRASIIRSLILSIQKQGDIARLRAMLLAPFYDCDDFDFDVDDEEIPFEEGELGMKLRLATTVFRCKRCRGGDLPDDDDFYSESPPSSATPLQPLFYPRVLGHLCLTRGTVSLWSYEEGLPEPVARLEHGSCRKKWSPHDLELNQPLSKFIETIVTTAGMDPETATVDEMNELNLWFACLNCVRKTDGLYVTTCFGWRDAAVHQSKHHGYSPSKWSAINSEELRLALQAFNGTTSPPSLLEGPSWLCAHCRDLPGEIDPAELEVVKDHLANQHNITEAEINRDYYKHFGLEPPSLPQCTVALDRGKLGREL